MWREPRRGRCSDTRYHRLIEPSRDHRQALTLGWGKASRCRHVPGHGQHAGTGPLGTPNPEVPWEGRQPASARLPMERCFLAPRGGWPLLPTPTPAFRGHYRAFCGLLASGLATWAPAPREVFAQSHKHTARRLAPDLPLPFLSWSLFTKQQLRAAIYPCVQITSRVAKQAKPKWKSSEFSLIRIRSWWIMRFFTSRMQQELTLAADIKVQQSAELTHCVWHLLERLVFPSQVTC